MFQKVSIVISLSQEASGPLGNTRERMLDLLRLNRGFAAPEAWVEYALSHRFQRVTAEVLSVCPDCGLPPAGMLGQYVYYSTLIRLRQCGSCGLIYADTRIDPSVIRSHFETAYKDEEYFLQQRARVFGQLVSLVDALAPPGGAVLDVGGAKGHLLAGLKCRRPDLRLVLNDLSSEACRHGEECFGLETVQGDLVSLTPAHPFDVVVMSDVIYYEPRFAEFWERLPELVRPGGTVIIRIPHKAVLIRGGQMLARLLNGKGIRMQERIRFFNPEHLYLLTRSYLFRRLRRSGFERLRQFPAELLGTGRLRSLWYRSASGISRMTGGRVVLTPSSVVVAVRAGSGSLPHGENP